VVCKVWDIVYFGKDFLTKCHNIATGIRKKTQMKKEQQNLYSSSPSLTDMVDHLRLTPNHSRGFIQRTNRKAIRSRLAV
jgi:hypothetical protein